MDKLSVVIFTSNEFGSCSYILPRIKDIDFIDVKFVVFNKQLLEGRAKRKYLWRKLEKITRIGVTGALVGIGLRSWYKKGVSKILKSQSILSLARDEGMRLLQINSFHDNFLFEKYNPKNVDLAISIGNPFIPKKIYEKVKFGMINIHHEILPEYQNAQSVIWQLYNKSHITGYTIHKVTNKIDGGDILLKEYMNIDFRKSLKETVVHSYCNSIKQSCNGLIKVCEDLHQTRILNGVVQDRAGHYTTPKIGQFIRIYWNWKTLKDCKNND